MTMKRELLAAAMALGAALPASAEWVQWRGQARDGVARTPAPERWPNELVRVWRLGVGDGQSSPVVAGGAAFVFSREGADEVARAVDLETGRERWRSAYAARYTVYSGAEAYGAGPKSTPVVHEGRLFTLGISGILSAFQTDDGRHLWRKDFADRYPATSPPFGTSMSPIVAGERLIAHIGGHDGGALIAFDPATGEETWVLEGAGPSYSSPILATFEGREQLVIQVHRSIVGVDPTSGERLWSLPFVTPCDQNIVTPLVARDMLVVSSLDRGVLGVRLAYDGASWKPMVAWETREVSLYMSSPLLLGDRVVGLSHKKRGQYFALDATTGSVLWKSEGRRGENAALVRWGEDVLVLTGGGELLIQPADAGEFAPRASYRVAESGTHAHPVPTTVGILIKDETALSLFRVVGDRTARRSRGRQRRGSHDPR